jgi:fluoroquinolone resistance protein
MALSEYRSEKFTRNHFTGAAVENCKFLDCDFSGSDLTETRFIDCQFYDHESQVGCNFSNATLKDASIKTCDLTMNRLRNINALGIEIKECRAQGANFRGAGFMNRISSRSWFCSACIIKSNLSYTNFSKVILEK